MASSKGKSGKRDRRAAKGRPNGSGTRARTAVTGDAKTRARAKGGGKAARIRAGGARPTKAKTPVAAAEETPVAPVVEHREPPALPVPIASFIF